MELSAPHRANAETGIADRIGFARLTKLAFDGHDLRPLWHQLMAKVADGTAQAGEGLDLSLIAQLLGEKAIGLAIQAEVLAGHRLYRSPCAAGRPTLRVLALAAAMDMGANTPIEFLLEGSDIELLTLYVMPDSDLSAGLPAHDVAIVVASDSDGCVEALRIINRQASRWPRPLLNPPHRIGNLDRDKLHRLLAGVPGLDIPATVAATRDNLAALAAGIMSPAPLLADFGFPLIVRPRGSHAGVGLAKIDDAAAMARYLANRPEQDFFIARFVDYASADGLYRKYRVVFVDGRPFACHMAISDQWNIWYLNAGMSASADKRREEDDFMRTFDAAFAVRHRQALAGMVDRLALDYFTIDCAENKRDELLVFEADNTAVVHNMDSPQVFPYKPAQMRKVFDAFAAMLRNRAQRDRTCAA